MIWTLPNNYHEVEPSRIVPADIPAEKIADYLKKISPEERRALIAREKSRLLNEPLDRSSLFNLGVLYGLEGDAQKSNDVALQAANRSFRDLGAQNVAINHSLARSNFVDALNRMDGLLRSRPEFAENYFDLILKAAATPAGLKASANLLATNPPWRKDFMLFATQSIEQKSLVYNLFTSLRDIKTDVSNTELRLLIDSLFKAKDYETAYFVWLDFLSPAELSKVNLIYDGGFDVAARNLNFGWNFSSAKNSEVKLAPKTNVGNDMALNLQFSALKGGFAGVSQYLRLDPGNYILKSEVKSDHLKTSSGIKWRIACIESPVQIASSDAFSDSTPWKSFDLNFSVPAENCNTQLLYLSWASEAVLDHEIDGSIVFDNFQINKANE